MWGAASSPHVDTPESLQEHTRTRPPPPTAAALSGSGMAVLPLPWQIRPLERAGGQGCPSAPVFVPQLGLVSRVLTAVHWFPLHVPRGSQAPPQSSSALSPERLCLWILAILFSPTFSSLLFPNCFWPPGSFRQHFPTPAQRVDPEQLCQVLQDPGTHQQHPPSHHSTPWCALRQPQICLQSLLYPQGSASPTHPCLPGWQSHACPAISSQSKPFLPPHC